MSSTTIQIEGVENVVKAYQHRKAAPWAIFTGRELLFSYTGKDLDEGAAELETVLEFISNSKASYKLRVYLDKDIKDGVIRSNTPDIGGINFRLNTDPVAVGGGYNRQMERELDELRANQKELLKRLEIADSDEQETVGAIGWVDHVKSIMEIPGVGELLSGIVAGFFNKPTAVPGAAIAGPPQVATDSNFQTSAGDQFTDLDQVNESEAVEVLRCYMAIRKDYPAALELLSLLAKTAAEKPGKIGSMVGMVKTFM